MWNVYFIEICCTPLQKQQQRDGSAMKDLMEICCLWHDIAPKIEVKLGHEHFAKLKDMFLCGNLALLIFEKTYFLNLQFKTSICVLEKNRVQNPFSHQGFGEKPCTKPLQPSGFWRKTVYKINSARRPQKYSGFQIPRYNLNWKNIDVIWNKKWQTSECDWFKNDQGIVLWNLKTALLWAQILTTEIIHHFGVGLFKTHAPRSGESTVVFKFRAMKLLLVWQTPTWNSCRLGKPRHETPADLANPDMKLLPVWQTPTWNSCPFGKPWNKVIARLAKPWKYWKNKAIHELGKMLHETPDGFGKWVYMKPLMIQEKPSPETPCLALLPLSPRTLDNELKAHAKAMASDWDWQRLSFVLEEEGKLQDQELLKAQSKTNSALQMSLQAGFSLFETNLQNDQLSHRRWLLSTSGDEAKARAAVVSSLEAPGCVWSTSN